MSEINISIVICTRNRHDSLKRCLESLIDQDVNGDFEIVVVDDGSTPEVDLSTLEIDPRNKIRIIRNSRNKGISVSRNIGVKASQFDVVAFTDDDCIAEKDWLQEISRPFLMEKIALVGGKIKDPEAVNLAMLAAKGHYQRYKQEGACNGLPGGAANLAVLKSVYLNSPVAGHALEDWEMCYRIIGMGLKIYYAPKAVVLHEHYHNLKSLLRQRFRYGIGKTWLNLNFNRFPLSKATTCLFLALILLPFSLLNMDILAVSLIILLILLFYLFYKNLSKGEKRLNESIYSFPVFIVLTGTECLGNFLGLFLKQKQINFGKDMVAK